MTMKAPSTALLRSFLRPSTSQCSQIRQASDWMPRERFKNITSLDKLHRKQKADNRIERQRSEQRAQFMPPPSFATSITPLDEPSSSTPSPPLATSSPLPYFIHRTKTRNFPVYESHKAGGSKHITTIRKCAGDLEALQAHITQALKLESSFTDPRGNKKYNVVVNRLTNQIVIRGWRGAEVKKWCELAGF